VRLVVEGFVRCYNKYVQLFVWCCGCRPVSSDGTMLNQDTAKILWFCGGSLVCFLFSSVSCHLSVFFVKLHVVAVDIRFFVVLH